MSRTFMDPDFEPRVADWLEADPDLAPPEVLATVRAAFPSIPQRRASRLPWRFQTMNRFALARGGRRDRRGGWPRRIRAVLAEPRPHDGHDRQTRHPALPPRPPLRTPPS